MSEARTKRATQQLLSKRQRILVICPFPEDIAPAQRLKYEQYIDHWRRSGYDVDVSPFVDSDLYPILWKKGYFLKKIFGGFRGAFRRIKDFIRIPSYDLVYIFLWVTPVGPPIAEWLVRKIAKKIVYDIDDNVHIGQKLPGRYDPNPLITLLKGKKKPLFLMQEADFVIASSPFLEQEGKKINRGGNAVYITSSVDTEHFKPRSVRPEGAKVVIGWTGTFSSRPFLDMIAPALRKLRELRDFELLIIGNFDYEMDGVNLKVVRFDKTKEIEDLNYLDIGIYPLPNDPWVLGKSGLKAIVYMAMGLPVVASNVGTTPLLYKHGEIGYLVGESHDEWVGALMRLIDNHELRIRMGQSARHVAVAQYSRHAVAIQYINVLKDVLRENASSATPTDSAS
jgi:glycosyltransferase involved in cell wall biosynthesis